MHLPDTFQPQRGQHVPYLLPAAALVAPKIVQIEPRYGSRAWRTVSAASLS
jgi:hypothetical protein